VGVGCLWKLRDKRLNIKHFPQVVGYQHGLWVSGTQHAALVQHNNLVEIGHGQVKVMNGGTIKNINFENVEIDKPGQNQIATIGFNIKNKVICSILILKFER